MCASHSLGTCAADLCLASLQIPNENALTLGSLFRPTTGAAATEREIRFALRISTS